ncbi:hypothetical protein A2U01_0108019, partial [Trifolium medium]|nr:hypothetical protein [Trifolium medium]
MEEEPNTHYDTHFVATVAKEEVAATESLEHHVHHRVH